MIPNSINFEEDDNPMSDFFKQYDGDDLISEDDCAFGIRSSVVEEASYTAFNVCESSPLYYLAGWAVFKELKTLTCFKVSRVKVKFPRGNFPNLCTLV